MEPAGKPEYRSYEKKGFATPSGKYEIFSAKLQDKGVPPLPVYVPIPAHEWRKEKELIFTVYRANVMTSRLGNAKWVAEILHSNPLWINVETAREMGLHSGDRVKLTSKTGSVVLPVRLTQGLHPQVVALAEGLGHSELGKIARAKKSKTSDFDTDLLWWEEEGNGVNTNAVVSASFDPVGGGIAWNDTVVTLNKA